MRCKTKLESLFQSTRNAPALPVYDHGSIWQHMSDALHQSLYRVLTLLVAVLPGILAFFVALLVFTVFGAADLMDAAALPGMAEIRSAPGAQKRRRWSAIQLADGDRCALLVLGMRAARAHHRGFGLRHFLCHRYPLPFRSCPISRMQWARSCCWLRVF